jgi:hypothetical protein
MLKNFEQFSHKPEEGSLEIPYNDNDFARKRKNPGSQEPFIPIEEVPDPENLENKIVEEIDAERSGHGSKEEQFPVPNIKEVRAALNKAVVKPIRVRERTERNTVIYSTKNKEQTDKAA